MTEEKPHAAPVPPTSAETVPQLLEARAGQSPTLPAQWSRDAKSGEWVPTTWSEYERRAAVLSEAFREHGLVPGERVGIIAPSSAQWDWVQMAVLGARGVVVGLDPHDQASRLSDIASCAGIRVLVAATSELVNRFGESARGGFRQIVLLDAPPKAAEPGTYLLLRDLLGSDRDFPRDWDQSQPDDTATIIFTSGTTGSPKGIAYAHHQVCFTQGSLLEAFPDIREGSHLACWLPLSNLFQRIVNICAIGRGGQTYYVENPREIMNVVGQINPTVFIGVPRFYEKLHAGMMERIAAASPWMRWIARWALGVGARHSQALLRGTSQGIVDSIAYRVAEPLVLRRFKHVLGNNLLYMISGSAPMPHWLLDRFAAMGLEVLEAYGLSENIVPIAANTPTALKFGSVGKLLRGNEVKLAPDGEVMVRGPGVFAGYYGETSSAGCFDSDGFLATGDFGEIDREGFLTLTGRKSEIFKTSTGRRIAPAHVESILRQVPFVEHAVVVGANRTAPLAVLSVSPSIIASVSGGKIIESAAKTDALLAACSNLRAEAARVLQGLPSFQRPEGFVVTTRPFTIEDGELTSNLKLRRPAVERRYASQLAELDRGLKDRVEVAWRVNSESDVVLCRL